MSNSQFHDAFVTLLSKRWSQQESPDEIDRDFRFMVFASVEIYMTGRGSPPPRPLRDLIERIKSSEGIRSSEDIRSTEDIRATGRGGPSPRPLHPAQLFATYGKLAMKRDDHPAGVR